MVWVSGRTFKVKFITIIIVVNSALFFGFKFQESAVENSQIAYIFPNILSTLYDKDVLDETAIIQWHKKEPALDQVNQRSIWKRVRNA